MASEQQKQMARRVAASTVANSDSPDRARRMILDGEADDWHGVRSALAAIMETQARTDGLHAAATALLAEIDAAWEKRLIPAVAISGKAIRDVQDALAGDRHAKS